MQTCRSLRVGIACVETDHGLQVVSGLLPRSRRAARHPFESLNAVHVRGLTGERSRTIPGIVGVAVTGWLVEATGTYSAAFLLSAAVSVMGALVYAVFFEARAVVE